MMEGHGESLYAKETQHDLRKLMVMVTNFSNPIVLNADELELQQKIADLKKWA
ncbi:hypothetical protein OCU04_008004 [Sclerotinia nivalis]|uniref:Uncharacterized protein n=1 Tax=Sclerotinia nivalis TaxID=352851 RepID=A0A9X0AH78_9HELO|nr:hypothetical protein OCU04_008004 [Sclerotinia nivalis]